MRKPQDARCGTSCLCHRGDERLLRAAAILTQQVRERETVTGELLREVEQSCRQSTLPLSRITNQEQPRPAMKRLEQGRKAKRLRDAGFGLMVGRNARHHNLRGSDKLILDLAANFRFSRANIVAVIFLVVLEIVIVLLHVVVIVVIVFVFVFVVVVVVVPASILITTMS